MKFIKKVKREGSYHTYLFTDHDADAFIFGDQMWSDGKEIDIVEGCDCSKLLELVDSLDNPADFKGYLYTDYLL